jgi:hypothetical protein
MELAKYVYLIYILKLKDKQQVHKRSVGFQIQYYQLMVKVWDFLHLSIEMLVDILIGWERVISDSINNIKCYIAFCKMFKKLFLNHQQIFINIAQVECITYEITGNEIAYYL